MRRAECQTPDTVEENPLEQTRKFWSRRSGTVLTTDEAREINRNLTRFFDLLAEWDQADQAAEGETAP